MHQWVRTVTADFRKFWAGQTISNIGSAFTSFALLLLVCQLTRSALGRAEWYLPKDESASLTQA
jgi:hypothetical protein